MATTNDKKNVSLGKPMASGCVYWAPAGSALPTDATAQLAAAYKGPGFISEDGITHATDTDTTEVNEMGGTKVINEISSYGETYQFSMLELNEQSMSLRHGAANVTAAAGNLTVKHKMPTGESIVLVFEILLTGNKVKRIVVPDAVVSEFGDTQYSSGDAIMYDVTYAANPSDLIDGASSIDYIAPISAASVK